MRYEPKHLEVRLGDSVRWLNGDALPHTVTSGAGREVLRTPMDSPYLMPGDSFQYTFPACGALRVPVPSPTWTRRPCAGPR